MLDYSGEWSDSRDKMSFVSTPNVSRRSPTQEKVSQITQSRSIFIFQWHWRRQNAMQVRTPRNVWDSEGQSKTSYEEDEAEGVQSAKNSTRFRFNAEVTSTRGFFTMITVPTFISLQCVLVYSMRNVHYYQIFYITFNE